MAKISDWNQKPWARKVTPSGLTPSGNLSPGPASGPNSYGGVGPSISVGPNPHSPYASYPAPLNYGHQIDPVYLNSLVADVQDIKKALATLNIEGMIDRLEALQERIELLEDDIAS